MAGRNPPRQRSPRRAEEPAEAQGVPEVSGGPEDGSTDVSDAGEGILERTTGWMAPSTATTPSWVEIQRRPYIDDCVWIRSSVHPELSLRFRIDAFRQFREAILRGEFDFR